LAKLQFQNFDKNENIEEHSINNFSKSLFGGGGVSQGGNSSGWRRNIAESFAFRILPKPQRSADITCHKTALVYIAIFKDVTKIEFLKYFYNIEPKVRLR